MTDPVTQSAQENRGYSIVIGGMDPCTYVYPGAGQCFSFAEEHVHQPTPCAHGNDERHHDYRRVRAAMHAKYAKEIP